MSPFLACLSVCSCVMSTCTLNEYEWINEPCHKPLACCWHGARFNRVNESSLLSHLLEMQLQLCVLMSRLRNKFSKCYKILSVLNTRSSAVAGDRATLRVIEYFTKSLKIRRIQACDRHLGNLATSKSALYASRGKNYAKIIWLYFLWTVFKKTNTE